MTPAIAPATSQRIFAPLPKGHWLEGELVLNNNSPGAMTVAPTFFSQGNTVPGTSLTLKPGEVRWIRVSELNASTGLPLSATDAIEIQYLGHLLELGAQLTLQGSRGVVDVPFSMPGDYRSSAQEAVWPAFREGRAFVAIGNASDQLVFVTLQQPGRPAAELELGPHMTRTVLAPTKNADVATSLFDGSVYHRDLLREDSGAHWMRLDVRGPIGSVRATGFIETQRGITGGIRFYDPATAQQPDLFATDLEVDDNLPMMVLKNTGDTPVTARARFLPLSEEEGAPVELPDVTLPPRGARSVDLTPLRQAAMSRGDLARVSAQVFVFGPAGSVVGSVYLVGRTGLPSYDVPLREPGRIRQSTGSYPWRLDGDYTTLISITNVSTTTAQFHARITSLDGGVYWLPEGTLKPGRTATFDMRALRDKQIRDMNGNTLPHGVLTGQFRWSIVKSAWETKLVGRAEIASRAEGRATSYSCPVCCPDSTQTGIVDPVGDGSWGARIGGNTGDIPVYDRMIDCYNNWAGDFLANITSWFVENTGIATAWTINTGWGRTTGNSEGSTNSFAYFNDGYWLVDPDGHCVYYPTTFGAPSSIYGTAARSPDPVKLQECLNVCNQGLAAIEQFCRSLPDPRLRALCWAARWSVPLCEGFCYAIWGS